MKRIFSRFKEKLTFKELPPPYRESENAATGHQGHQELRPPIEIPPCEVLDLLANCRISSQVENQESEVEYAEIEEMGLWHSTPLSHRHKSKISLTWVLKENLENTKLPSQRKYESKTADYIEKHQRRKLERDDQYRKCNNEVKERVVGRNEYYHNLRFKSACEEFVKSEDTWSDDTSVGTEETRRRHRHRHRRRKRNHGRFGYDIRDLDIFLSEASIDRPGNIPVVIAYPTTLYQTQKELQRELCLPLGTVVNAVFKNQQWLYAQTPHGDEGYVLYNACLPLGILPNKTSPQKKTPCWESSTDIYPRPCGNLTDTEKEQLRGRTRSECRYRTRNERRRPKSNCAERDFDSLYLRTKSVCSNIDRAHDNPKRQTLLLVNSDFKGSDVDRTLSVKKGDVVVLAKARGVSDGNDDWFYVKKKDGSLGFIPAAVAGHGYI